MLMTQRPQINRTADLRQEYMGKKIGLLQNLTACHRSATGDGAEANSANQNLSFQAQPRDAQSSWREPTF